MDFVFVCHVETFSVIIHKTAIVSISVLQWLDTLYFHKGMQSVCETFTVFYWSIEFDIIQH